MGIKQYRKYNKILFVTLIGILAFLIVFNILINPFEIFNTSKIKYVNLIKPDKNRQQRITKIVELKLYKQKIDTIFLGSSRVDGSIDVEYYKKISDKTAKNLAMNALTHSETVKLAENITKIHPEIKIIYIGLDFFRFLESDADDGRTVQITANPKLTVSEFNPIILSFDTTIASFNTFLANLKTFKLNKNATEIVENKADSTPNFEYRLSQYAGTYQNAKLSLKEINKLKKLQNDMKQSGITIIFYTNPTHATDIELIKQLGYLDTFNSWKNEMANQFTYIDFDFVNDLTSEKIDENTEYFYESSHSTPEMGNIVLERLVNNKYKNYGIFTTRKNVGKNNQTNLRNLRNWEKNNDVWVEKIKGIKNAV